MQRMLLMVQYFSLAGVLFLGGGVILHLDLLLLLLTAIGFSPGGSSLTLVQTNTITHT
jgi:hypothetical protein